MSRARHVRMLAAVFNCARILVLAFLYLFRCVGDVRCMDIIVTAFLIHSLTEPT
jgi:hypothetical protein